MKEIVGDIFLTIPSRYRGGDAPPGFRARIGFDIDGIRRTVSMDGAQCLVSDAVEQGCDSVIRTGMDEWIGIASHSVDPVALFLAKKLVVEGDIEAALAAMGLIDPYRSEKVVVKDPSWVVDTLGPHFPISEDGHFMVEGIDCADLAERYGTPLFVTSEGQLRENIRTMKAAFAQAYPENAVNVMWAIKSNTTLAFRRIMNQEGAGGDCFSPGEIYATFVTGADPDLFVLNGSDRSEEAFRMAIEIGMRITIDHIDDLSVIERLGQEYGLVSRCLIRVKCPLNSIREVYSTFAPGIKLPMEVLNLKFGVTYTEAVEIALAAKKCPHVTIEGIHSHIGRDVHLPVHWRGYAYDMVEMCGRFREDTGITALILDLGGGFAEKRDPSSHDLTRLAAPAGEYADSVAEGIRQGCADLSFPFPQLWVEPGRNLIGPATVLISRVGNVKRTPGVCTWVHVDASCNFLPSVERHNGMSYHLLAGTRVRARAEETVDVVGPNCSGDIIQPRRRLPRMERGDLLVFLDAGAYNLVAANQFNSIPRPASVLVGGTRADVVQERETIMDIFARQRIPAWLLT
ncbi:MAG TPA: SCP2 sterol-binding domain-containing protein [Deltaproteobacteria bacterium]|nr:SCP2 sterol-binding domain-containing protein [Deltaproteobacteria bacterium]